MHTKVIKKELFLFFTSVVKLKYPVDQILRHGPQTAPAYPCSCPGSRHFYHDYFILDVRLHNVNGITRQSVKTLEPVA